VAGAAPGQAYQPPPSLAAPGRNQVPVTSIAPYLGGSGALALGGQINEKIIDDHLAVQAIIRSYQVLSSSATFFRIFLLSLICKYNINC
jgi:2-oxoglutarate dehydrogenase E1 component